MDSQVRVEQRDATLIVSQRRSVRLSAIGMVLRDAFGEVYGGGAGMHPAGPPFVIYHGVPDGDEPFDIEICAPIAVAVDPPIGWAVRTEPGGTYATLLHIGPYDRIATAYAAMGAWIATHDRAIAGPPREVYLSPPGTPPEEIRTSVEYPLQAVPVATPAG